MGSAVKKLGLLLCFLSGSAAGADDLVSILDLALENDPALRQARSQYRANRESVTQSLASLLPSVSLSGTTTRQTSGPPDSQYRTNPLNGDVTRLDDHSFRPGVNSHQWSLGLQQSLFNMSAWYSYQSARASDRAAAVNFAAQEQDLIMRVATAYFDVLRAIDLLETNVQEEEAALTSLQQTQRREEVGLDTIIDVYDAQAAYDLARNTTILQQDILQSRYEALEAITGQAHPEIEILQEEFPVVEVEGTLEDWESMAMSNSLAIAAAEYNLEASRRNLDARKADHYPTITLQGGYRHSVSPAIEVAGLSYRSGATNGTQLILNMNIPLYSGGATQSRQRAAEYNLSAARESLELTERQLTQNIRNAYRRVNTDVLVIAQRQQSILSAQSALDQTTLGIEVGQRNIVELLRARENLYRALRQYADARYNYVLDSLILKQVTGVLSPEDVMALNEWLESGAAVQ